MPVSEQYYQPCPELTECSRLIETYFNTGQYERCFRGHLALAQKGYPLAECQVGYFYYEGLGVEPDVEQAFFWTERAARHGDRDGQYNLGWFYEEGVGRPADREQACEWFRKAALQRHELALEKCRQYGIRLE